MSRRPAVKGRTRRGIVPKGNYPNGYWTYHFYHRHNGVTREIWYSTHVQLAWVRSPEPATGDPGLVREAPPEVYDGFPRSREKRDEFIMRLVAHRAKRDGKALPEDLHGYADYFLARVKRQRQYKTVANALAVWKSAIPNLPLASIKRENLEHIRELWWEDGYSGNTINNRTRYLGRMFRRAIMEGVVASSPAQFLRAYPANSCTVILEADQEPHLFAELPEWVVPPSRLALMTGLRLENAALLLRAWVEHGIGKHGTIIVPGPDHKGGRLALAFGGTPRTCEIPLDPETLSLVTPKVRTLAHGYVFSGQDGGPIKLGSLKNAFRRAWDRAVIRIASERGVDPAGIQRVRFHDLRHTFATRYLLAGGSPHALVAAGLWASIKALERYANLTRAHIQEDFAKVRAARGASA